MASQSSTEVAMGTVQDVLARPHAAKSPRRDEDRGVDVYGIDIRILQQLLVVGEPLRYHTHRQTVQVLRCVGRLLRSRRWDGVGK